MAFQTSRNNPSPAANDAHEIVSQIRTLNHPFAGSTVLKEGYRDQATALPLFIPLDPPLRIRTPN